MSVDIIVAFVLGVIYGFVRPGKEDRSGLMKSGAKMGLVIGILFGVLDFIITGSLPRLIGMGMGSLIGIILLTIIFVVGTLLGDFLEVKLKG